MIRLPLKLRTVRIQLALVALAAAVSLTFASAALAAPGDFFPAPGSPASIAPGSGPNSIAIGDFDNDGNHDLAVTNSSNTVSILLGKGGGGFGAAIPSQPLGPAAAPRSIVADDFNMDGKDDLAVASHGSNDVAILTGDGSGGFSKPDIYPLNDGPISIAIGDFNQDGKRDLAVAEVNASDVYILFGDGKGAFTFGPLQGVTGFNPTSITRGDFNNDGRDDLAVANSGTDDVSILLGKLGGGFDPPVGWSVGINPASVATGDFNHDKVDDVAVANTVSNNVTILLSNGGGSFDASTGITAGLAPRSVVVGDFDQDGKHDLAVANSGSNDVSILLGNGAGGFTAASGSPESEGIGFQPNSVAIGNINGDGAADLAIANSSSDSVSILLGATDKTPPETKITKKPRRRTTRRTAKLNFASSEPGSTFTCKLDRQKAKPCGSSLTLRRVRPGTHVFRVYATDAAGNTDPTPAKVSWRVVRR